MDNTQETVNTALLFTNYEVSKQFIRAVKNGCRIIALVSDEKKVKDSYKADEVFDIRAMSKEDFHRVAKLLDTSLSRTDLAHILKDGRFYLSPAFCLIYKKEPAYA